MRTIFFGPWVGEFGWEYSHWHAWVNQASSGIYKNDITIASSFEGREPFYSHVSKFVAHPSKYNQLFKGKRNYITDRWVDNRPSFKDFSGNENFHYEADYNNQIEIAKGLLNLYKKTLPDDTIFYVPWLVNKIDLNGKNTKIGVEDLGLISERKKIFLETTKYIFINRLSNYFFNRDVKYFINAHLYQQGIATFPIDLEQQKFFTLQPIKNPSKSLVDEVEGKFNNKLVSIFPRRRDDRRPDKNFGEKKYIDLIKILKKKLPNLKIALLGEPGGSYFNDGVPDGCIDLINIPDNDRMNNQLYILQNSIVSLGSISGAMLVSLGAGCPSLIWGFPDAKIPTQENNPLSTSMHYINNMHPDISDIIEGLKELNIL